MMDMIDITNVGTIGASSFPPRRFVSSFWECCRTQRLGPERSPSPVSAPPGTAFEASSSETFCLHKAEDPSTGRVVLKPLVKQSSSCDPTRTSIPLGFLSSHHWSLMPGAWHHNWDHCFNEAFSKSVKSSETVVGISVLYTYKYIYTNAYPARYECKIESRSFKTYPRKDPNSCETSQTSIKYSKLVMWPDSRRRIFEACSSCLRMQTQPQPTQLNGLHPPSDGLHLVASLLLGPSEGSSKIGTSLCCGERVLGRRAACSTLKCLPLA